MVERKITVSGVEVPTFMYGTAWKEERTAELVGMALDAGFVGIDTANQRRHYVEAGVGEALKEAQVDPAELFIQTKFTPLGGQDHRLPYDPAAPVGERVEQSFRSSQEHLGVDTLDAYVLHGPSSRRGLGQEDWEIWRAMESLHARGEARLLGVSNVSLEQLEDLCDGASVKPAVVQNRCFARTGWDREVRALCRAEGMVYQGFSLLTANRAVLEHPSLFEIAQRLEKTPAQVIFRFALQVGMVALTGTTSREHMAQDLAVYDFALEDEEVEVIEGLVG